MFNFFDLCGQVDSPLGASDYSSIANNFHAVLITDIPQMFLENINEVRRLITCIDQLYERKCKLFCTAAVPLSKLFISDQQYEGGAVSQSEKDEAFAWDRTMSRLMEMQSSEYMAASHQKKETDLLAQLEIQHLTVQDADDLFAAYDTDGNGHLDRAEFLCLMADLCELRSGHRNADAQLIEAAFDVVDTNGDEMIEPAEFRVFCLEYGMEVTQM